MSWFTKLFGLQSPSDTTAKSTPTRNAQQAQRQTQPTAQKAPSPAVNKTVTAAPTAAPKRTTRSEDDELRNAVAKIEASVKERNDPEFPILTLSVHRQSEDTAPVMICLPEDRKNVPTEEDVCIIWLYPYDKGLGYADAEELLRSHLKPLDYKLAEPRTKYSDGKKSYHHWIAKKVPVEPEPPTLEAKAVLEGHTSYVNCVCYSPDGKMIASGAGLYGDSDNTVRLWDADTGKQRTSLKGRTDRVVDIAYTPDGKLLASVGSSICLWNISSEQPVWQLEMPQGYRGPIRGNCVCFSPDGKMMACGCSDASVRLWDVESGSHIREMQGHRRGLDSVAFSPNGRFLASGSADGTVRIWEASTGREVHTLQGNSACYSPDGSAVASASPDRIVRIWDTESGKQLKSLEGHDAEVTCVWLDGSWSAAR